ncbi:MAG TPA: hypothetical protein ENF41_03930, partial [Candidatus Bathyarchaeota archaeon]|nr:hypothetical protein [Candidatus Bathyarchaeota archaeon]
MSQHSSHIVKSIEDAISGNLDIQLRKLQKEFLEKFMKDLENAPKPYVVKAPCGYGKTLLGSLPILCMAHSNHWLCGRLVYTLPIRVLTKNVFDTIR